ncbi:tubulin binding cofactor C-domain-containing protein [Cladochytrium replicatum]|nr:tubulin binding cofactor C-domain-containing protein [Cladochytrium replicatum]
MEGGEFYGAFARERNDIASQIQALDADPSAAEDVHKRLLSLEKRVTESFGSLPTYDQQQYMRSIKELSDELVTKKKGNTPKAKFSFKRAPKVASSIVATPTESEATEKTNNSERSRTIDSVPSNALALINQSTRLLTPKTNPESQQDIYIHNLDGCFVLPDQSSNTGQPIGAVHIKKLTRCIVILGPVSGSLLVDECAESILIVACRQFRMHNSRNTKLYIHVPSHPIIEDCTAIKFGPLSLAEYPRQFSPEEACHHANLDSVNKYDCVEDFNWLRQGPSPNWNLLGPEEFFKLEASELQVDDDVTSLLNRHLPST